MEREGGGEGYIIVCADNDFAAYEYDSQLISVRIQ